MAGKLTAGEWTHGDKVTKEGYGYFGIVLRMERQARTRYAIVQWEGSPYTRREYPDQLTACPVRPPYVVSHT
jgi:hypothetical protein